MIIFHNNLRVLVDEPRAGRAELDLLVVRGNRRLAFEFKRTTAPVVTHSVRAALRDLHLNQIVVVHAGFRSASLDRKIRAIPLDRSSRTWRPFVKCPSFR